MPTPRVKLKLDGTEYVNATGSHPDEYFALSPAPPRLVTQSGETFALFDGETAYGYIPYSTIFDKFFAKDSSPGRREWAAYAEFEIPERVSFYDTAEKDVCLFQMRGLFSIFLKYVSGDSGWRPQVILDGNADLTMDSSTAPSDPGILEANKKYLLGVSRSSTGVQITLKEEGNSTKYTKGLTYGAFPPTINYAKLPEVYLGAYSDTTTGELKNFFGGKIFAFGLFDGGGLALVEGTGDLADARDEQAVFLFLGEDAVDDRMVDSGQYQFETYFDAYSGELGALYYQRGTRGAGEYLAALEGVALATDGPVGVDEDNATQRFYMSFRKSLDANVASVKRGNKVFAVSNKKAYVLDDTSRKARPLGIPKVLGNPSLGTLSQGVLDDVYAYGYRWVTSDGTKGPFTTLGSVNAGEDAKIVIGESDLVLGLDYVDVGLNAVTDAGNTERHEPVELTNDAYTSGFPEDSTFTFESYIRIPDAATEIRESIWDAGCQLRPYQNEYASENDASWRRPTTGGNDTQTPYRGGIAHTQPLPTTETEGGFTHVVAFEIGYQPHDGVDNDAINGFTEMVLSASRAPMSWEPNGAPDDEKYCPDLITLDPASGQIKLRLNGDAGSAADHWGDYAAVSGTTMVSLDAILEVGDRVLVAHTCSGDSTSSVTHNVYVQHIPAASKASRYDTAPPKWYSGTRTLADTEGWEPGGYYLGGLVARDAGIFRHSAGGGNVQPRYTTSGGGALSAVTEMLPASVEAGSESSYLTWFCNRVFQGAMSLSTIQLVVENAFPTQSDAAHGELLLDTICRPESPLDEGINELADASFAIGSTLFDYPFTTPGGIGWQTVPQGARAFLGSEGLYGGDIWFNEVRYRPASAGSAATYPEYVTQCWRLYIDEHFIVPFIINEDADGVAATHKAAFAFAYTPFGDGSYQVFHNDRCIYRETKNVLRNLKTTQDKGTLVEQLSVEPQNFHWLTATFNTSVAATDTKLDLQKVFIGGNVIKDENIAGTLSIDQNNPLFYMAAGPTNSSSTFPNQGGLAGFHVGDVRVWNGAPYSKLEDFNFTDIKVPTDLYEDLWLYFDIRPEYKVASPDFNFANLGTFGSYNDNEVLQFDADYHTMVGETAEATTPLPSAPEVYITGLELGRTARFGLEDNPSTTEIQQKLAEASNGPFYLLDFLPRGQKVYIDNTPDINLGVPIDPGSGDYPRVVEGVARWGDHITFWGDPAEPASLYVSEPGPYGWESYPYTLRFDTSLREVKAVVTIGRDAIAMSETEAVALGGDPSNPQEIRLGSGMGAQSARAAGTFDGVIYAFNGRVWAIDPSGQAQDIGLPIQDILPTTARIRFSGVLSSMLLIDEDDGRVLRFYLPTKEWFIEDRNARDCFEAHGRLYWISRAGELALDQSEETSPKYGDDFPSGLSSASLTATAAAGQTVTVTETLPTSIPSPYDGTQFYDLKGVKVAYYPAAGTDPLEFEVDYNTANTMVMTATTNITELQAVITAADPQQATVWVGTNSHGLVLDTGWIPTGSEDAVLGGVRHSIQAGAYWSAQSDSREFLGDPVETASWTYGDAAAISSDGEHAGGTRGKFHRVRVQAAAPTESKASWISMKVKGADR